jgi:predicted PurR-regulated permease PerM
MAQVFHRSTNTISRVSIFGALFALLILGVPFAVPLAMWAGLADLIPAVGSYLGAVPAIIVAFFVSPVRGLITLAYFIGYQQFENYVLVPKVMQNTVNLSPAAVIVSTLIGGSLFGFAGALLALPVAATVKVVITETWLRDRGMRGDELAKAHVEAEGRAEAETEAGARERAAQRRRLMERVRSALRPSGRTGGGDDDDGGADDG